MVNGKQLLKKCIKIQVLTYQFPKAYVLKERRVNIVTTTDKISYLNYESAKYMLVEKGPLRSPETWFASTSHC